MFLGMCLWGNIFWMNTVTYAKSDELLATQEVEKTFDVMYPEEVKPMAVSDYYNNAKGWEFNDIVYLDSCEKYSSAYGGTPVGTLQAGEYRFVKTNGSYVAICEVELATNSMARSAYKELWEEHGGMWSWEQALYNQLDGTRELSKPTDMKTVRLENGRTVTDETQNFRFIYCWIKIEDLQENTQEKEYEQRIRYFVVDPRTGISVEDVSLLTVANVRKNEEYSVILSQKTGYYVSAMTVNGESQSVGNLSYTVSGENEICVYFSPYRLTVNFNANGGTGSMATQICYYGERQKLNANSFLLEGASFIGWALSEEAAVIECEDGGVLTCDLTMGHQVLELYAVWDYAPEITLKELYFTKQELISARDMKAYVLSFCGIADKEDGNVWGDGTISAHMITDIEQTVADTAEGWVAYTVEASDSGGNEVSKRGRFYVVDVAVVRLGVDREDFRFISTEYMGTLEVTSAWRMSPANQSLLRMCLNKKTATVWKLTEFGWQRVG